MATPRKRNLPARRRTAPRKKSLSIPAKIAIGAGVLAAGWLIYDRFIKKPEAPQMPQALPDPNAAAGLIGAVQQLPENTTPKPAPRKLSPIGTPENKQSWNNLKLFYGDKGGEIETMQKLFNRVSKLYNQPTIKVDGVWGPATEEKKLKIMGSGKGFNLTQVYKVVKSNEQKAKKGGEWNEQPTALQQVTNAFGGYSW
jgi:hypothetical protein